MVSKYCQERKECIDIERLSKLLSKRRKISKISFRKTLQRTLFFKVIITNSTEYKMEVGDILLRFKERKCLMLRACYQILVIQNYKTGTQLLKDSILGRVRTLLTSLSCQPQLLSLESQSIKIKS